MITKLFNIDDIELKDKINNALKGFRGIVENPHEKQYKFVEQIIEGLYTDNDLSKVNVVPVRCGFGKSVVIKLFLRGLVEKRTKEEKFDGAIVVTDNLERLKDIKSFDGVEDMCSLIKYNDENSFELYEDSMVLQLKKQYLYPILLMTSQRFERLSKKERGQLYKWKNGERKIIIFDEKPFIYKQQQIDIQFLATINKGIYIIKEGKEKQREEKQFLINEFRKINNKLEEIMDSLSKQKDIIWFKARKESLFGDEYTEQMFLNVAKRRLSADIYIKIKNLMMMYSDGALFINKKTEKYDNDRFFILLEDNTHKFDKNEIKNWIFDATSRYDVEYDKLELFKFIKIDDIKENNLQIININVNMSKQSVKDKNYNKIKALNIFLENKISKDEKILIVSYRNIINKISTEENHIKLYFGNTKGFNQYREISKFIHAGWNRQPDYYYIGLYLLMNSHIINIFNNSDEIKTISILNGLKELKKEQNIITGTFENEEINHIMLSKILVDFEQNIFRTQLRNFSSDDIVTIYIFCTLGMKKLLKKIENRFKIKITNTKPAEFLIQNIKSRNNIKMSIPQLLLYWWDCYDWDELHISEILKLNQITQKQFNKAKEKNKNFKEFMDIHKCGKNHYCKFA